MHGKFAAAKVSTFVVSDFCVVWDFDCQRLCITPLHLAAFRADTVTDRGDRLKLATFVTVVPNKPTRPHIPPIRMNTITY